MFKSKLILVAVMSAVSMSASVSAMADGNSDIINANNQVGIQYTSTQVNYSETGDGRFGYDVGTLDTENGSISGFKLSASAMRDVLFGNDYLELSYARSSGSLGYLGSSGGSSFGSYSTNSSDVLSNYEMRYGKGFAFGDNYMLTPYATLGHHEWDRNVGNVSETFTNNYYGVGTLGQYSPMKKLVLSGDAMIGETFGGNINANVNATNAFSAGLGNNAQYRIGVSADYAITKNFHANVGIERTNFDYGASATVNSASVGSVYEPDSQTIYTVMSVGVGYAF